MFGRIEDKDFKVCCFSEKEHRNIQAYLVVNFDPATQRTFKVSWRSANEPSKDIRVGSWVCQQGIAFYFDNHSHYPPAIESFQISFTKNTGAPVWHVGSHFASYKEHNKKSMCRLGTESQLLMLTTTSSNGFSDTNITCTYCSSSSISRLWLHCK
jgi:hypothetical protein